MPAGRRITRTKKQRRDDVVTALHRSGFSCLELLQILLDWSGWESVEIQTGPHVRQVINKSKPLEDEYSKAVRAAFDTIALS